MSFYGNLCVSTGVYAVLVIFMRVSYKTPFSAVFLIS